MTALAGRGCMQCHSDDQVRRSQARSGAQSDPARPRDAVHAMTLDPREIDLCLGRR